MSGFGVLGLTRASTLTAAPSSRRAAASAAMNVSDNSGNLSTRRTSSARIAAAYGPPLQRGCHPDRTMKRPGVIVIAVLGALLAGLLVYGVAQQGDDTSLDAAVRDGKRPAAPDAARALPRLDGSGTASLADYRGKVV